MQRVAINKPSNADITDSSDITIGVLVPLTGPAAQLGEWMLQGVRIAEGEINTSGGIQGKRVRFVIEDDQCDGKVALSAYQKLQSVDKVKYIVGPLCGSASVPVSALAEKDEVILLTTGLASQTVIDAGDFTFTVLPSMRLVAQSIVRFAADNLGVKQFSIIYSDDEYGSENLIGMREFIESHGGTVVKAEQYKRGAGDYRTMLAKIDKDESEAVVIAAYPSDYASMLAQAEELQLSKILLAISNIQAPAVSNVTASTNQRILYAYPSRIGLASVEKFQSAYRSAHPNAADLLPVYIGSGYDGVMLYANALRGCPEDQSPTCVRNMLMSEQEYNGANGPVVFDKNGNNTNVSAIEIRVLEGGTFSRFDMGVGVDVLPDYADRAQ